MMSQKHDSAAKIPVPVMAETHNPSKAALALWEDVTRLGLQPYVAELEVKGFTVIPPHIAAPPGLMDRLREAVLDVAERRNGVRPRGEGLTTAFPEGGDWERRKGTVGANRGHTLTYLLFEDPVFQEALVNPASLTMAKYLVGERCAAYANIAFLKGPGGGDLGLHTDNLKMAPPFPTVPQICNVTWVLSDYSKDNGSIAFVPGSHRLYRHPQGSEGLEDRVAVDAPAGSMIIWGGSMWHGAFGRKNIGMRMTMIQFFSRPGLETEEPYRQNVTEEILARNSPEFAQLLGQDNNFGWKSEGPQNEDRAYSFGRSWFD